MDKVKRYDFGLGVCHDCGDLCEGEVVEDDTGEYVTYVDYKKLEEDARFLQCLMATGVDNWDGYDIAQEMMDE